MKHHRRSIRLKGYDYSSCGAYVVTFCTKKREPYLADLRYYQMVEKAWQRIPRHFPAVVPDSIGIVPDHIHMIVCFEPTEKTKALLGTVVGRFKSDVSREISLYAVLQGKARPGSIWQEGFYDRIIRDECELERESRYVLENPEKHWLRDGGWE